MTNPYDTYTSPLATRNASPEMLRIWSPRHKFTLWRKIWLAVAKSQKECGLPITDEQIAELEAHVEVTDEDIRRAEEHEGRLRHDVMAHVHAYGDVCPKAKGIIHLGMTSQDVVCNADLLLLHAAFALVFDKADRAVIALSDFARRHQAVPTLGFTHYQPAQPTTVGRRAVGWAHELYLIMPWLYEQFGEKPRLRGFRGATGTQASFLSLFDNNTAKVERFEALALWNLLTEFGYAEGDFDEHNEMLQHFSGAFQEVIGSGINELTRSLGDEDDDATRSSLEDVKWDEQHFIGMNTFELTGQTYPRVYDAMILSSLGGIAAVLHKIATDIRLLSNRKELDEPFGKSQIGSSAMPYKRNPMRCERICGLARFVMNLVGNAYDTAATQWLERTLDDSSNRRLSLPEAFLALDGALDLMHNVASGLEVHEAMVRRNLMAELPFLATENILMAAVKVGGDRQDLHERIRVHSQEAGRRVKDEGLDNDLIDRLKADPAFAPPALKHALNWDDLLDPMKYVGRSVEQTERFICEVVEPLREQYGDHLKTLGGSEPRV